MQCADELQTPDSNTTSDVDKTDSAIRHQDQDISRKDAQRLVQPAERVISVSEILI